MDTETKKGVGGEERETHEKRDRNCPSAQPRAGNVLAEAGTGTGCSSIVPRLFSGVVVFSSWATPPICFGPSAALLPCRWLTIKLPVRAACPPFPLLPALPSPRAQPHPRNIVPGLNPAWQCWAPAAFAIPRPMHVAVGHGVKLSPPFPVPKPCQSLLDQRG